VKTVKVWLNSPYKVPKVVGNFDKNTRFGGEDKISGGFILPWSFDYIFKII